MTQPAPIRHILLAFGLHTVQTTPYIVIAILLARHNLVPVLGAVLVLALCVLCAGYVAQRAVGTPAHSEQLVPETDDRWAWKCVLAVVFAVVSSINWLAHMTTIAQFGPVVGVTVALASSIGTLWIAQLMLKTDRHKASHLSALILATLLVVIAFLVIVRSRIDLSAYGDARAAVDAFKSAAPLLVLSCGIALATVLKATLSDPNEATLRGFSPFGTGTLVALELSAAAAVALSLNYYLDGFTSMAALAPASIDPLTWSWDHWGLLWVGVVNTAIGLLVLTRATNVIGVPVMTAVGQSRPALTELLQIILGFTALTLAGVTGIAASCLLLLAASLALRSRQPFRFWF